MMSTDPTVVTGDATQNLTPATETEVVTPEGDANAESAKDEVKEEGSETEAEKALKRMQRRIDKRTADVYRAKAEADQLKARLAELEAKVQTGTQEQTQAPPDVEALANYKMAVREFSKTAEQIVTQGTKAHADFQKVVTVDLVNEVGPLVLPNGLPSPFMAVVLEATDDPKALLYHLGSNPELAEELADLTPIKLAKRLDRIERELADKAKPKPGTAPKPIEAVKSSSTGQKSPLDMTPDEFREWRIANGARRR